MQYLVPETQQHTADLADAGDKKLKIVNEIRELLRTIDFELDNDKENAQNTLANTNNVTNTNSSSTTTTTTTATNNNVSAAKVTPTFPGISQLLPHLYLCGAGVALPDILDQLGVTFVISAAPELPDTPLSAVTKPLYLRIPLLDRPDAQIAPYFDEVADIIEGVRQHNGVTLVHCVAGVSRSATLCLAYLMKHAKMTLREAYQHVKAKRPQIRPNTGFFEQLRDYDKQLYGACSVQMIYCESLQKHIPDVYEPEYRAMEQYYQRQRKFPKSS